MPGDVAVLDASQHANTTHRYLHLWIEDLGGATLSLSKIDGECSGDAPAGDKLRDVGRA